MSETVYEYDESGRLVRAVTTAEPDWTDHDRGLALALAAERAEICTSCGHPMSVCRDPSTAQTWTVVQEICQPSVVAQVVAEQVHEARKRGVIISTRRS